jgi:hypothetical protein
VKVLGIDPGTAACGYGIVQESDGRLRAVASGCWRTSAREPLDARLLTIFEGVRELIAAHEPDAVAHAQPELPLTHRRELKDVRDASGRAGTVDARIRIRQIDGVQGVEHFRSELDAHVLHQREVLEER